MKNLILTIAVVFLVLITNAQAPQSFKYQAIVRDNNGQAISNQQVSLQITLLQGSTDGIPVYSETHNTFTNEFGLMNIEIGKGRPTNLQPEDLRPANLSSIDWSSGSYFVKIEIDPAGGSNYKLMGTSQLLSVPYALYAETSGSGSSRLPEEWNNDAISNIYLYSAYAGYNVGIGTTQAVGKLHVQGNGFSTPLEGLLKVEHSVGYTSTFRRVVENPGNALFLLQKARGTISSPTTVLVGDNVGMIRMEAYDGTAYKETGWIRSAVDGSPSPGSVPGNLIFATTTNGSLATEKMRITSAGNVGIATTNPVFPLEVVIDTNYYGSCAIYGINKSSTGDAQQKWGILGETRSTTWANTGAGVMGYASATTGAGEGIRGESMAENGFGVVARAEHTTGVNYGLLAITESPNGYAGYFYGGKNYFQGYVGIGTTEPFRDLHVKSDDNGSGILLENASAPTFYIRNTSIIPDPDKSQEWALFVEDYTSNFIISNGTNQRVFFEPGGEVGIADSSPDGVLELSADNASQNMFLVSSYDDADGDIFKIFYTGVEGYVGIGTTMPLRTLHVNSYMHLEPVSDPPPDATEGDIYYDIDDHMLKCYDGSGWQNCW